MSDEESKCPPCPAGAPAWMGTFADMMSLLMCFFILLLSFSEMDAMKFKRLAGSMAQAFGVQNKLKVLDPPKGTSIIAQEFSPGRPDPTPINQIYQHTSDLTKLSLQVNGSKEYDVEAGQKNRDRQASEDQAIKQKIEKMIKQTQGDARELAKALQTHIAKGEVEVETRGRQIIIRIKEKGSFASGSARLADSYIPTLREVRDQLANMPGNILVQGHTDNVPINTPRFRSNWELSTSRAVSVAQELLSDGVLDPHRLRVSGFADTRPIDTNNTPEGRARNRRVEIVIQQGLGGEKMRQGLEQLKRDNPKFFRSLKLEDNGQNQFNLERGDVF